MSSDGSSASTASMAHRRAAPAQIPGNTHVQQKSYDSVGRDSFFAFIPKLLRYGASVFGHEAQTAQRALLKAPRFSVQYAKETLDYYRRNPKTLYKEIISGFTVAIMQVPESIAFSFVAGVPPLSGLHATFWMATITGLLGGKPGMISGAAGALAVVVAKLTSDGGVLDYLQPAERLNVLYMTMIWCGVVQILFAWLRLAKVVRLIPETGMIGFMNGLAIIIFRAQLPAFKKCEEAEFFVSCTVEQRQWLTFGTDTWPLLLSLFHVALCMFIMNFFPLFPKVGRLIPASLVGLSAGTVLEHTLFRRVFDVATRTVRETAEMSGSLPKFDFRTIPTDGQTIGVVAQYAITLAAIGSVESVLTLQACNEITDTVPKMRDSNRELFAQGLGNLVSGFFRAMGGDAMIGQSTINIMNGARHRVSSTMSGIFMLLFVIALSPLIELLPVSTLTGVLFMVVISTFQWKTFEILRYGRLSDSGVIILVTAIAVQFNLAIAIAAGVAFSALVHAWDSGDHVDADIFHKRMRVRKRKGENIDRDADSSESANDGGEEGGVSDDGEVVDVKYVQVKGAIFFGSARHFINVFNVSSDPDTVVIDLKDALVIDHSAVAAIGGITHRFAKVGKRVLLVNVPQKSHGRLHRTGDHGILHQQIVTDPEELHDDEHGVEAAQGDLEAPAISEKDGNEDAPAPHFGTVNSQSGLGELNMFRAPVDGVSAELEKLQEQSEQFEVSDADSKKNS